MSSEHGQRWTYNSGCRCVDCRVANAAYLAVYRTRIRMERSHSGAIVNGHETARMIRTFKSEGYRPGVIARLIGISQRTLERHYRSRPVRLRIVQRVRSAWNQLDAPEPALDPHRRAVADGMLHNLAKGLLTDAAAWQDLKAREDDDYYS